MKVKLVILLIVLLAILAGALYLKFSGVTHERIYDAVKDESGEIKDRIDERYRQLDTKLDRIESKLDRILELANRPLADGMRQSK